MISFDEALKKVFQCAPLKDEETIAYSQSLMYVLSRDVISDINMPPFDKSAMDGYACRREDLFEALEVIEVIPAGKLPEKKIEKNQCSKIMTGARVPDGADTVIMVEQTEVNAEGKVKFIGKSTNPNICIFSEDLKTGDIVLRKGSLINAGHIAVMATTGCIQPFVYTRPTVCVVATGNELTEPDHKPTGAQIRNSNGPQLCAQLKQMGIDAVYFGIIGDSVQETEKAIQECLEKYDVTLLSGGVSMGDYDFVPAALKKNNVVLHFEKIAIQPGKPTVFGMSGNKAFFGMPGNPVSTFTLFEILVKPFLYKMMGHDFAPYIVKAPLQKTFLRRRAERLSFVPVLINSEGFVELPEYHGSAHISAMTLATGFMPVPIGVTEIKEGELVSVRQF
jgi:molybdopterin molybdotransferase